MGYGKHFDDMYTGSMFGQSTDVFAVWGYVISNMRVTGLEAHVELYPQLMAAVFGSTPQKMVDAIAVLEAPDDASRSTTHEGRRLILVTDRTGGPMQFLVVNGYKYRFTRDEDARKATNRKSQRKRYAKRKALEAGGPWNEDAWEPDGADKVLAIQKPMEKEGL